MNINADQINERLTQAIELGNVFGLPALLIVLVVIVLRDPTRQTGLATLDRLGRTHLGLAFWSLTTVVSELWDYRAMGIFPANPITGLFGSTIVMALNVWIGFGLLRRSPVSWWLALLGSVFRTAMAVVVTVWFIQYSQQVNWLEWPRQALFWLLPPFEIAALLARSTRRSFRTPVEPIQAPWVSTLALIFQGIAIFTALTDAIDWSLRTLADAFLSSA